MKKHTLITLFITSSLIFEVANLFAQEFSASDISAMPQISISEVDVLVDNIREERIEEQLFDIARSQFNAVVASPKDLAVKIAIRQRSYYKNIDNRNSIYVHYTVCDTSGERIFEDCLCTEGSGSIVSAAMQTKQMNKAAKGLKKFLKKQTPENPEKIIAKR